MHDLTYVPLITPSTPIEDERLIGQTLVKHLAEQHAGVDEKIKVERPPIQPDTGLVAIGIG